MRFGISTHLFHEQRLCRDHLAGIADRGFEAVELFATSRHFDYHDATAVDRLKDWLRDTDLQLHGIHVPVGNRRSGGGSDRAGSNATTDTERRQAAIRELDAALNVARRIPTSFLVVQLGTRRSPGRDRGENNRDAARRSLESIQQLVEPLGVRLALEVVPNGLSDVVSLTRLLEDEVDLPGAGICLDFGHAFLMGDLVDAIEAASGHLIATHVNDNHGAWDEHLAPFDGRIDWAGALMATRKIGYDGTWLMELVNTSRPATVLDAAQRVRRRFERLLR